MLQHHGAPHSSPETSKGRHNGLISVHVGMKEEGTMEIKGVAAIVTGAGSGLGEATARALAGAGAKVAVFDVNEQGAAKVAAAIGGVAVRCDVSDAGSAETAFAAAREAHGPARIAVNCAGIAPAARIVGRNGPLPLENFAQVVAVNLLGTFNIMRLAAADMQGMEALATGERGVIVSTASIAAFEGQIGQAAYAASKGGVVALTLPAAREFARHGIRVLTIAPGTFGTPMLRALPEETQASLGAAVPFPSRLGDPAEFAALVLHMVDNVMLNGETIRLDGALRMPPT
jgi:NAD(P)-dependent dehydrogenase (short-subunit alcohol dehydrogenase family)